MGNETHIDVNTLQSNSSQERATIDADGRRLVQFFDGTELWDNYNHLMLVDQFGTIVHKAWWNDDPPLNVSLIERASGPMCALASCKKSLPVV